MRSTVYVLSAASMLFSLVSHADMSREQHKQEIATWLSGDFSNYQQSISHPGLAATPIMQRTQKIEIEELDELTLLNQQSFLFQPEEVVRRQVYSLSLPRRGDYIEQTLYHIADDADTDQLKLQDLHELHGCEVRWYWDEDKYVGTRNKQSCYFFAAATGQQVKLESYLELTEHQVSVLDRAYLEDDTLVLGDEFGVAVNSNRMAFFAADISYRASGAAEDDWQPVVLTGAIHDQGSRIGLQAESSGLELSYQLELLRTASDPAIRTLRVYQGNQVQPVAEKSVPADQQEIELSLDNLKVVLQRR
ncbi:hypothetical protein CWE09_00075 [Aliidiomarina minuta]|uniref:Uncharacterized protein n=1 Tax=Aliidiomarina minuta TaxID=880057 RepID=A0A432W542_9GAMM|nr:CpcT/CpeT family chromophore lyase [Aliidiomarina minuta]RUO25180.1 hypothetical protein CWE09_00075 [Aliidiomarina minuta]